MRKLNVFQSFIAFLVDATVAVLLFQVVALLISYFYFLPAFPGIYIVWLLYYIIAYWKYGQTLGQAFFRAGITVEDRRLSPVVRIVLRESLTSFPAIVLWIGGWDRFILSRSFFLLLGCLVLTCFRKKMFGICICKSNTVTGHKSGSVRLKPVSLYFILIIAGISARLLNAIATGNDAVRADSLLYAAPRPTVHSVKEYVRFLAANRKDINDYVMELFDEYDHVILCERHHQEMTQYDMIYRLITDPRFVDKVGVVFTEIGCAQSREAYRKFVETAYPNDTLVEKGLASFMTENQSVHLLWPNTNWFCFLKRMYYFNRDNAKKVKILFADNDWLDRSLLGARDSIMADNIISTVRSDSIRKSLIIMNYRHAYLTPGNCGYYVERNFPGKVANVMINFASADLLSLMSNKEGVKPIQHGKWDVACSQMPDSDFAFDFNGSPFGKDRFDHFPLPASPVNALRYQDMFTGFIYYKAPEEQYTSLGYNYMFDDGNLEKLEAREQVLKEYGYSLHSWDFLKDGLFVAGCKEIYYEVYRRDNLVFLGIWVFSLLLDGILLFGRKHTPCGSD